MPIGKIKYWNEAKGFGFAQKDDGTEAFVHISNIVDESIDALVIGQRVSFSEQPAKRGTKPEAVDVVVL